MPSPSSAALRSRAFSKVAHELAASDLAVALRVGHREEPEQLRIQPPLAGDVAVLYVRGHAGKHIHFGIPQETWLSGDDPLTAPKDPTQEGYLEGIRAADMQAAIFDGIATKFIDSNYNLKTIIKELVKTPYYRAVNASGLDEVVHRTGDRLDDYFRGCGDIRRVAAITVAALRGCQVVSDESLEEEILHALGTHEGLGRRPATFLISQPCIFCSAHLLVQGSR